MTPSVFMYSTPQGIVYAPATASVQDKQIFNFQQIPQALSQPMDTGLYRLSPFGNKMKNMIRKEIQAINFVINVDIYFFLRLSNGIRLEKQYRELYFCPIKQRNVSESAVWFLMA